MTDIRTISDIANAVRGRRLEIGLSQDELAGRAGVSRKWIYEFEAGKPGAQLGIVLLVLDSLGLALALDPVQTTTPDAIDLDAHLDDYARD